MLNRVLLAVAVVIAAVIAGGYYQIYYGCDRQKEHDDIACVDVFLLSTMPVIADTRVHFIGLLSNWGLIDFKSTIRSFFDRKDLNTSLYITSPNFTQFPITTQEWEIYGYHVYSYTPNDIQHIPSLPVLVYFHGGGGAKYTPKFWDASMRYLSHKMKQKIIIPDYPRSPQFVIPVAHDECLRIVTYIFENSEKFGVDKTRISIGGDSFGSHATLYIAFKWRDLGYSQKYAPIHTMSLICPWVQFVNMNLESFQKKENQPRLLTTSILATYISLLIDGSLDLHSLITTSRLPLLSRHYQERQAAYPHLLPPMEWEPTTSMVDRYSLDADKVLDPFVTFLFQPDFSGLPPTLIICAEYDVLLTEGELLKERLEASGVEVEYFLSEKMFHGFFTIVPQTLKLNSTFEAYAKVDEFMNRFNDRKS